MSPSRRSPLLSLRILVWRTRHVLTVGAVLLAGATTLRLVAPPPPPTRPVVVTASEVDAGAVLRAADLRVVRMPAHLVPDGAVPQPEGVVGRGAAVRLSAGLPVVGALLEGDRFSLDPPPGTVVVPVALDAAASSSLLRPGDLVDLVVAADSMGLLGTGMPATSLPGASAASDVGAKAAVLADRAIVLDVGARGQDGAEPSTADVLAAAPQGSTAQVTLVAVSPEEGRRLAAVGGWGEVGAVLVG